MKAKQEKEADVKPTETSPKQQPTERTDEKSPVKVSKYNKHRISFYFVCKSEVQRI